MKIRELNKEDVKELKKDGYICITTDISGNITGIFKTVTEAESADEFDTIIL